MIGNSKRGPKQWVLLSGRIHSCGLFRLARFGRITQVLMCMQLAQARLLTPFSN